MKKMLLTVMLLLVLSLSISGSSLHAEVDTESILCAWAQSSPLIDGVIDVEEWRGAVVLDISNKERDGHPDNVCYLYVQNDESYLYVAFDVVSDFDLDGPPSESLHMAGEHITVWIDGDNDRAYPETAQNDVVYRVFAYVPYDYPPYHIYYGPSFQARRTYELWALEDEFWKEPLYEVWTEPFPTNGTGQASNITGHAQYELKIPLTEFEADPGTTVGVFLATYNLESTGCIGMFPSGRYESSYIFHPKYWAYLTLATQNTDGPLAIFDFTPETAWVNETIIFNSTQSHASQGNITCYIWSFGDENATITQEPIINHTYSKEGRYNVTLEIIYEAHSKVSISSVVKVTYITDLNKDLEVNMLDISTAAKAFGTREGDLNYNIIADLDGNKKINMLDISRVAEDYGALA